MPIPRKKFVAGNWKMNMTSSEVAPYLEIFNREIETVENVDITLIPSFTALAKASEILDGTQKIRLGAQNMSPESKGAFTGEISVTMLRDLFVRFVLVGHSERRRLFGETDEMARRKIITALATEIRPILCIGETLEERQAGQEKTVLEGQLRGALEGLSKDQIDEIIVAYEPVWAIGTGLTATPAQAQEAHHFIRAYLSKTWGPEVSSRSRILYGGSVTSDNARVLLEQPDIDGALVGGASLDPRGFAEIVAAAVPAE
ncbi:MAG: triose-phosphate isomerase [Verrucomicrobia bacterium]|nr:MAG: triose-phosphate isomerase [Verrucomicrobiota bacterium]